MIPERQIFGDILVEEFMLVFAVSESPDEARNRHQRTLDRSIVHLLFFPESQFVARVQEEVGAFYAIKGRSKIGGYLLGIHRGVATLHHSRISDIQRIGDSAVLLCQKVEVSDIPLKLEMLTGIGS